VGSDRDHEPGHSLDNYLDNIRDRIARGELGAPAADQPDHPLTWPAEFRRRCQELGVQRYARELARIDSGELPTNALLQEFRREWRNRRHQWDSAILVGHTGIGKSVAALDACREESKRARRWCFVDFGQLSMAWRSFEEDTINAWKHTPLLVVDEIAMAASAAPGAFALFHLLINLRYRNDLPTILCTVDNVEDLEEAIGPELCNRFPVLCIATEARSYRPGR